MVTEPAAKDKFGGKKRPLSSSLTVAAAVTAKEKEQD